MEGTRVFIKVSWLNWPVQNHDKTHQRNNHLLFICSLIWIGNSNGGILLLSCQILVRLTEFNISKIQINRKCNKVWFLRLSIRSSDLTFFLICYASLPIEFHTLRQNIRLFTNGNFVICELELELENCLFDKKKKYKHDTISHRIHDSMVFFVGRPLQRRWSHRLRKGHPRLLQCINRHCTMKGQTFGSVGKLNTHTSWDRAPSRLTRGTQLTIIMRGKETKTSVLHTTS